jgi:hypothetical protein
MPIRDPVLFSQRFGVPEKKLRELGIFDPVLNADTRLSIDPLVIAKSRHRRFGTCAMGTIRRHFSNVILLLRASRTPGDRAWRAASELLNLAEGTGTCLGYGTGSVRGRRADRDLVARFTNTAKEVVDLGVQDPALFLLLPVLEDGIGPDTIGDLTTNIILPDLAAFTSTACRRLRIPTQMMPVQGQRFELPLNPTQRSRTPLLLLPSDILRPLPVASSWAEVADNAAETQAYRREVSRLIGDIWSAEVRNNKEELRRRTLASKQAFESLLQLGLRTTARGYSQYADPEGFFIWRYLHATIAARFPLALQLADPPAPAKAIGLVRTIVDHFTALVEKKGVWKVLWHRGRHRNEKTAQMVFFAVADAYCKANNLDVTPEADTGNGPVDFKFSEGYDIRVLVELKLSSGKLLSGYKTQVKRYEESQTPLHTFYLVVQVGPLGRRLRSLSAARNARLREKKLAPDICIVDATERPSASKE